MQTRSPPSGRGTGRCDRQTGGQERWEVAGRGVCGAREFTARTEFGRGGTGTGDDQAGLDHGNGEGRGEGLGEPAKGWGRV